MRKPLEGSAMRNGTRMRTFAVFLGGVVLAFMVPTVLGHLLTPGYFQVLNRAVTTPADSPQWGEVWEQLERGAKVQMYVADPIGGLIVGVFVGLLLAKRAVITAVACLVPGFLDLLLHDHLRTWATSASGIFHYSIDRSLPFIAAIVAAALCQILSADRSQGLSGAARK
jgi:hypothetical protein